MRLASVAVYQTFLLDADDTLFDFGSAETSALKATLAHWDLPCTEDVILRYKVINFKLWAQLATGDMTKAELQTSRFTQMFKELGVSCDPAAFNQAYLHELGRRSSLIDGALEICQDIVAAGGRIYIVTNGLLATQTARFKHSSIRQFISGVFVSEVIGYEKPDPAFFEYVFAHIPRFDKAKTLLVGDSLKNDIAGGINSGLDTCWLNPSKAPAGPDIVPTYQVSSLLELRRFLPAQ